MTFDEIFTQYYNLYRAEATVPSQTDDEWTIGMRFANDAIRRWAGYDNTFWQELWTNTAVQGTGAVLTTTSGTAQYAAPTGMKEIGGYVKFLNANGTTNKHIPMLNPNEGQFKTDMSNYFYVTGNPNTGFTLNFNVAPDTSGLTIYYDYYKSPTLMTDETSEPDMSNPDFIVNHMLANRFRASRNPYYGTAKRDAENMLAQMKMQNDSGTWANPWSIPDNSGTVWGSSEGPGWSW